MRFRQQRVITNLDAEKNFVQAETEFDSQQAEIDAITASLVFATPVSVGTANAEGSADSFARSDHVHAPPASESWIEVGSGGSAPAFTNGWVNYGGALQTAAFYKDPFGVVRLKGMIASGTIASAAFTLPAGYRPPAASTFVIMANSAIARLIIAASGNVTVQTGSNVWASLDGISFRAA